MDKKLVVKRFRFFIQLTPYHSLTENKNLDLI